MLDRLLTKLEARLRGVAEAPFEEGRHPLVLRRRLLGEVERHVRDVGLAGQRGLKRLGVTLLASQPGQRAVLEEAFVRDDGLAHDVRQRLREAGVPGAERVRVGVEIVEVEEGDEPDPDLAERGFRLEWPAPPPAALASPAAVAPVLGAVRLVVEKGAAEEPSYTFEAGQVVNIGRMAEVVNEHGHVVRRNDVAFDEEDALGQTVSRVHAHLTVEAGSGRLRLHDDGSAGGTTIYRPGRTGLIQVRRRGQTVLPGDLLYFGKACLRLEAARDDEAAGDEDA